MKQTVLLTLFIILKAATTFAQTKDCYPNCAVGFEVIVRERIPSITSVEAIGTKCKDEIDKKLQEYRNADLADFTYLKNKYCAAMSGWEQTGDCVHGGPPPCCTAPAAESPWASVGEVRAKAALMSEWHKIQNQRQVEIEKNLYECLHGLKTEGLDKFNDLYAQASDCEKSMEEDKIIAQYNKTLTVGYINQLNDLHQQMQTCVAKSTPDPNAVWNITNEMIKLQAEICDKSSKLKHKLKATPGTVGGTRGEVEQPKVESVAISNSDGPQLTQKAAYQQQANNFLKDANNSTEDIDKARNMNMAKINAAASGNTAQIEQIQQEQNEQMAQSINTLSTQLSGLLTSPTSGDRAAARQANLDHILEVSARNAAYRAENKQELTNTINRSIGSLYKYLAEQKDPLDILYYLQLINYDYRGLDYSETFDKLYIESSYDDYKRYAVQSDVKRDGVRHGDSIIFQRMAIQDKRHYTLAWDNFQMQNLMSPNSQYLQVSAEVFFKDPKDGRIGSKYDFMTEGMRMSAFATYFDSALMNTYNYPLRYGFKQNLASALYSLKKLEDLDFDRKEGFLPGREGGSELYYHNASLPNNNSDDKNSPQYAQIGFLGLKKMVAYAMEGEIYYDSLQRTKKPTYAALAYEKFKRSLDYYFTNLDSVSRAGLNNDERLKYNVTYKNIFYNYMMVCYHMLYSKDYYAKNDPANQSIECFNNCVNYFNRYYLTPKTYGPPPHVFTNADLKDLADKGDLAAMNDLGVRLFYGDVQYHSFALIKEAADRGNVMAQCNLAGMYLYNKNRSDQEPHFLICRDYWFYLSGAQYAASDMYETLRNKKKSGIDFDFDDKQALYWYQKAADQGYDMAEYCLGSLYEFGIGVKPNKEEALKWYMKAADQKNRLAIDKVSIFLR